MAQKKQKSEALGVRDQPSLHTPMVVIKGKEGNTAKVTQAAFDAIWKHRGWTVVDDKKDEAHSTTQPNQVAAVTEEETK